MYKVNNKDTRRYWHRFDVVNFEYISHLFSSALIVYFEQVNVSWVLSMKYWVLYIYLLLCFTIYYAVGNVEMKTCKQIIGKTAKEINPF